MDKFIAAFTCIAFVLAPHTAMAQETDSECREPVAVRTPCTGVLLPTSAATEGLQCLSIELPKLRAELQLQRTIFDSRLTRYQTLLTAEEQRSNRLMEQLRENAGMSEPRWYEHPAFHFALGFVVASAATIGITYAVNND